MNEQETGAGGSANTPPFPRLVSDEENTQDRPPTHSDESNRAPSKPNERIHIVAEAVARPEIRPPALATTDEAPRKTPHEPPAGESEGRPEGPDDTPAGLGADAEAQRRKATRKVNRGLHRLADQLEDAAARIDGLASGQLRALGSNGRAADTAHSAAGAIGGFAEYLRRSDLHSIREDVQDQVREKPLKTLLIAAGTGWLIGKIMR